jgi:hypothetical protein
MQQCIEEQFTVRIQTPYIRTIPSKTIKQSITVEQYMPVQKLCNPHHNIHSAKINSLQIMQANMVEQYIPELSEAITTI